MDWIYQYGHKIVTAKEAAAKIHAGDRVAVGQGCGRPTGLVEELIKSMDSLAGLEIVTGKGDAQGYWQKKAGHFRLHTLCGWDMEMNGEGICTRDSTPCHLDEIEHAFETSLPLDAALLQLAPPDDQGRLSFGGAVDYIQSAAKAAKVVIAQINKKMPRAAGDAFMHIADVDFLIPCDEPLQEAEKSKIGDVPMLIGKYCAGLVNDGDTLQIGTGAIADAILFCLSKKKDLGIHTAVFTDAMMELMKAGVVTNLKKAVDTGLSVAASLWGSMELYHFLHYNHRIAMSPLHYVADPKVLMQLNNFVSIHVCGRVDLTGQFFMADKDSAETDRLGGGADWIWGAGLSENGRVIMTLPATSKNGRVSNVVAYFENTVSLYAAQLDVDYVVTEFGVARLRGRCLMSRAEEMIRVAHPSFRPYLRDAFEKRYGRIRISKNSGLALSEGEK